MKNKVKVFLALSAIVSSGVYAGDFAKACNKAYKEGNPTNLFDYCSKGAAERDTWSTYILGNLYFEGIAGVTQDRAKGIELWQKAANSGLKEAQHNVGRLYHKGIGVEQSYTEALKWYEKAAEAGDAYAMHNIGYFHQKGTGVPKSPQQAEVWYTKSASLGLQNSQYNLAVMYFNGEELSKDLVKAYAWIYLANEKGYTPARNDISAVANTLSKEQKSQALKMAKRLVSAAK